LWESRRWRRSTSGTLAPTLILAMQMHPNPLGTALQVQLFRMISIPQPYSAHSQQEWAGATAVRTTSTEISVTATAAAGADRRARKLASTRSALVIKMTAKANPGTNASPSPRSPRHLDGQDYRDQSSRHDPEDQFAAVRRNSPPRPAAGMNGRAALPTSSAPIHPGFEPAQRRGWPEKPPPADRRPIPKLALRTFLLHRLTRTWLQLSSRK
jgi:hypothetical protein